MSTIDEEKILETLDACVASLLNHRDKLVETIRTFNKESLERLENVEKERNKLMECYKRLENQYNLINKRDAAYREACSTFDSSYSTYFDSEKHELPTKHFDSLPVYADDLTITINVYGKGVCINIRKLSSLGKAEQAVTLNPDEFEWLTGGQVSAPREGQYNRIQCASQPKGGWRVCRIDPCENPPLIPRFVDISMATYQTLFNIRYLVCERSDVAESFLHYTDELTMHREMVVMIAQIYSDFEMVPCSEPGWTTPSKELTAEIGLSKVKLPLVKAVFAGCGAPIPKAETMDELIGGERGNLLKRIAESGFPTRAQALFTSYIDHTKGAVDIYTWMSDYVV